MRYSVPAMSIYHYQEGVLAGIDASRRVGWAKYFDEEERNEQLETVNSALRDVLDELADAVLYGHKGTAFGIAMRVRGIGAPN